MQDFQLSLDLGPHPANDRRFRQCRTWPDLKASEDAEILIRRTHRAGWPWETFAGRYRRKGGYRQLGLPNGATITRARAVADAWLEPRPPGALLRHLDGNPLNDRASNLAWGTTLDNHHDAVAHGTVTLKLTADAVLDILHAIYRGETHRATAARHGVTETLITRIQRGKKWAHVAPHLPRRQQWEALQPRLPLAPET